MPPEESRFGDANFIPSGQSLDVRGKDIFGTDGHAHAEDTAAEEIVSTGRTRAVDVREFNNELVDDDVAFHESLIRRSRYAFTALSLGVLPALAVL